MEVKAGQRLWRSKYALTKGIDEVVAREDVCSSGYIRLEGDFWGVFKLGRDVHETAEGAIKAAEAARAKRIASLEKQIAKLKALTF